MRTLELDERKKKILDAVIRNYMETGEPVGSRTISKYTDLNLSSATIRNEMADLEELGLIVQPHTSAGRIPSDKGYRLYVDNLMKEKDTEIAETKEFLLQRVDRLEVLLRQMAKLLATNTNYATMISGPQYMSNKLKFIQLSAMEGGRLLTVIVVEGNIVKNTILDVGEDLSEDVVLRLNLLLNTALNGLSLNEINLGLITKLKEDAGEYCDIVGNVLEAVAEAIKRDGESPQIYTSGTTNIFNYPELSDGESAKNLISTFEEKEQLSQLLNDSLSADSTGIQVYIGDETPVQSMKDCSVVTARYELGDGIQGTIGIIGPKRMDYDKVVGTLKTLMEQLDTVYKKKE